LFLHERRDRPHRIDAETGERITNGQRKRFYPHQKLRESSADAPRHRSVFPESGLPEHQCLGIGRSFRKKAGNVPSLVLAIGINLEGMRVAELIGAPEPCFHGLPFPTVPWAVKDLHPGAVLLLFLEHMAGRYIRAIINDDAG
jgi:hypothetical protein